MICKFSLYRTSTCCTPIVFQKITPKVIPLKNDNPDMHIPSPFDCYQQFSTYTSRILKPINNVRVIFRQHTPSQFNPLLVLHIPAAVAVLLDFDMRRCDCLTGAMGGAGTLARYAISLPRLCFGFFEECFFNSSSNIFF